MSPRGGTHGPGRPLAGDPPDGPRGAAPDRRDRPSPGSRSQDRPPLPEAGGVAAVPAAGANRHAAGRACRLLTRARPTGRLLGAGAVPGAAAAWVHGRLRHGEAVRAAAACGGSTGRACERPLRDAARTAEPDRLGRGPCAPAPPARAPALLRADAGLQPAALHGAGAERTGAAVPGRARAGVRSLRRAHTRAPVRPATDDLQPRWLGRRGVERDVPELRPLLGLRAAAVPAVPGAHQG